jgi:hypothetical protein
MQQVEMLKNALQKLSQSDKNFAQSLIDGFTRYNRLSDKQLYWVDVLTKRANGDAKPMASTEVVKVVEIKNLFAKASNSLKRMKIRLKTKLNQNVVFTIAGERSKYAGQVMITDGGPFGDNKYFGKIDMEGNLLKTGQCDDNVLSLIKEFADNPAETAGKYGRLTGNCCFCMRGLDDERSVSVGYGPVCAGHYGLPWGEKQ